MKSAVTTRRPLKIAGPGIRFFAVAALLFATGCARVSVHNRDTVLRTRTEKTFLSDWTFKGYPSLDTDSAGQARAVVVNAHKDKACLLTEVKTVDRVEVTEREMQNQTRSRNMAYTMGGFGAAGAVTNIVLSTTTDNEDEKTAYGVLAGFGAYLSIMLIVQIVREFAAIDTEKHIGEVDVRTPRRARCEGSAATGARVRLLKSRNNAVAEAETDSNGRARLSFDPESLPGDSIYAVEVNGVIVNHIELTLPKKPINVAAPP